VPLFDFGLGMEVGTGKGGDAEKRPERGPGKQCSITTRGSLLRLRKIREKSKGQEIGDLWGEG